MQATVGIERKLREGGILLVDKPSGMTSHDVVANIRKYVRPLRVGHTGTLDPLASGLLILCLGEATRIAAFIEAQCKRYEGVALLGVQTDTQDVTGNVCAEISTENLTEKQIRQAGQSFIGVTEQQPPAFSAVKVGGVRAYKLARRQRRVTIEPRRIEIRKFEIYSINLPRVRFIIECSKGTYVRTVCHDLGTALGVGGCLESLRRLAIGRFELTDAKPLSELSTNESIMQSLLPASEALSHLSSVVCTEEQAKRVAHGMALTVTNQIEPPSSENAWAKAVGYNGELLAVGVLSQEGDALLFRPKRVFAED